jgi:hypothetical protein
VFTLLIDLRHERSQGSLGGGGNFLKCLPKRRFYADTGFAATDNHSLLLKPRFSERGSALFDLLAA